ncbi:MAG: AraC family transcriptional regulator [Bacteroidetes bacterium]|nr:MAG: AraC family transcriptional regulator [Bacteroidota bacterium]REK34610.1 MAG: AraC family transcriptional regulator [Bacteroidota bacterium]
MIAAKLTSFFVIVNFGSLILLSFLSLANPLKANQTANRLLGVFFLLWASFWADEISFFVYHVELNQKWQLCLRGLQYFTPIMFYIIVVLYSKPGFKFKTEILPHFIPPVGYIILLYYFNKSQSDTINYALVILMLSQSLLYTTASYFRIRKHQKVVLLYSSQTSEIDLSWLEKIVKGLLIIVIIIIFYNIIFSLKQLNLIMNVISLIGIFYIAFHALKQKEIYPFKGAAIEEIISLGEEPKNGETKKKIVTDEELVILKSQLTQFMLIQKPYLDPDLNLVKLAELFGTSAHKLSYIINTGFNLNFFNFINKHRVEEAKLLLLSPKTNEYSILGVAFESGFNSKSAFNTTFKKFTNQTPSDFKKSSSTL